MLTTRSRAETATLKRRKELEKEIEINERERLQTAVEPQDDLESSPSVSHSLDLSLDDSSAVSITSSSMQSSVRDLDDGSTGTNLLAEFSPGEYICPKSKNSIAEKIPQMVLRMVLNLEKI